MKTVKKTYVDLPDGQMHVSVSDGSGPAIVYLHQTASSGDSFHRVMEHLSLDNRQAAVDTPGFGGSFDPTGWPSISTYAGCIVDTLDRLNIETFHLFGHHTGGNLAAYIAQHHAKRVHSVMILGPVPMSEEERIAFRRDYEKPISPRPDGSHLVENWDYCHKYNPGADLEIIHEEVVHMIRAWKGRAQAYRAVSFHDLMAVLARLTCPLLFLSTPEDFFYPRFADVCALRPDAKVTMVGGENLPPQRDPEGLARAIETFVNSLG